MAFLEPTTPRGEQWKYLFKLFPLIDLPFGIACVLLSDNWIATLCMLPLLPATASTILILADRRGFQPGPWIFLINGINFVAFTWLSGPNAPAWGMLINVAVGSSFMFNNPRVGQVGMAVLVMLTGALYWLMGAGMAYSAIITFALLSFILLFSRTHDYMQLQQKRIEVKNQELESKNKDITDSINYAKKIQYAVLPHEDTIYRSIPLSFILYKPRDIVSGDFFWFHEIDRDNYIIVCADCTGHGVPGAMMTVIGSSLLNQTVIDNKIMQPSQILLVLDSLINITLKQQKDFGPTVQDGMDLSLLKVDKSKKEFTFTSAKRPAVFIRDGKIEELKGSKNSLGGMVTACKVFNEVKMNYHENDIIYFYTDGYTDQFGGAKGKKFSSKRLRELFLSIHRLPMNEQKQKLDTTIEEWKGTLEQVDDIQVIGIRF